MPAAASLAVLMAAQSAAIVVAIKPLPEVRQLQVEYILPSAASEFSMPAWRPGDYQLFQYARTIAVIEFRRAGKVVQAQKQDADTWRVEGGADQVMYRATESSGNFTPNLIVRPGEVWMSGPVFGWFEGMADRPHRLRFPELPGGLTRLYTALPMASSEQEGLSATAASYEELMDSPILLSNIAKSTSFTAGGKRHDFVAFGEGRRQGALDQLNLPGFASLCQKVVLQGAEMFGSLPYPNYVFFGDFGGGYGGLEHRASTRLGLGTPADPLAAAGLISHEFFHTFNVKQIRPKAIDPYDFSKPAEIESLWWLEGVTDYYSAVWLVRAGVWTKEQALAFLGRSIWAYENRAGRESRTAAEVSRRVWEEKGSQGSGGVSYYEQGKVIGFLLDLAIRRETKGAKTLDDVMKALYAETAMGGPGYEEPRLRELLVKIGGDALGPIYTELVRTKGRSNLARFWEPFGLARSSTALVVEADATEEERRNLEAWPNPANRGTAGQE